MMKKLLLASICLTMYFFTFAQDSRIVRGLKPVADLERVMMPEQNNKELMATEMALRATTTGRAPRFAVNLDVNLNPDNSGTWETMVDGRQVWRLVVYSKGAKSLNLGFNAFVLPSGASLVLYASDESDILGKFTEADNDDHEQFWSPVIATNELVVELVLNNNNRNDLQLNLNFVNHDYMDFMNASVSGSCNLDVICGEADGWAIVDDYRDIIQSVAVISTGGGTFCTGFLVNNVNQDCTPFFMTANHCGIGSGNAASLVCYWNYENSYCREPGSNDSGNAGDGVLDNTTANTGSVFRAGWSDTDFTLVELDDPIPLSTDPFLAGWNAVDDIPQSAIGVHHPSTDEKRISFEEDACWPGSWGSGDSEVPAADATHMVVPDWDIGTTEPGSSGSPLFDAEKRVVGQLHGGGAACGNDLYDIYGWFAKSWEGGGTSATRLKDWLDPDDTGTMSIPGKSCAYSVTSTPTNNQICSPDDATYSLDVSDNFGGMVTLTLTDIPAGLTSTLTEDMVAPGGSTVLTITNTSALTSGTYNFLVSGTDGTNNAETNLSLTIFSGVPATATLNFPADGAVDVSTIAEYDWMLADGGDAYEIQVASDMDFNTIVYTESNLVGSNVMGNTLSAETTYWWRLKSTNLCGESAWSAPNMFTTADISCSNIEENEQVDIDDGPGNTVYSYLTFSENLGDIIDVNVVDLTGTHTYLGDLDFTLISPAGTEVLLVDQECGTDEDFFITFDDDGEVGIPCPYTDGASYAPVGNLSDFNGETALGVWTLRIDDNLANDGGALESWTLSICGTLLPDLSIINSTTDVSICSGEEASFEVTLGTGFNGDVTLSTTEESTITPNPVAPGGTATITLTNTSTLSLGNNNLPVTGTDGTDSGIGNLSLEVIGAAGACNLQTPINNASNVSLNPNFNWTAVGAAEDYEFQIATDPDFNNIVETIYTGTTSDGTLGADLMSETTYYWRVTTLGICGGSLSTTYSFTTEIFIDVNDLADQNVSLYPNPTSGDLSLVIAGNVPTDLQAEIFSVDGRLIQQKQLDRSGVYHFNLEQYTAGIYVVKIVGSGNVITRKIILNN